MGQRSRRKAAFLAKHPLCCFCGGLTPAMTEDHVPARSIFDGRDWPKGYSFPACDACNRLTREEENVLAFLSRINPGPGELTELQKLESRQFMASMRRNYPKAFELLAPSANQVRRFLKDAEVTRPPGKLLRDVPLMSFGQPEFVTPIKNFGIKLFCALHYMHTGSIAPAGATVSIRFVTNVQLLRGALPDEIFHILGGRPVVERGKNDLQEQFSYIYGVSAERDLSAYVCKFRASFVLIGIVTTSELPSEFDEDIEHGSFRGTPFVSAAA